MSQERYVKNMHNRLNMSDCNPVSMPVVQRRSFLKPEEDTTASYPYRKAVESLIYLMAGTRLDISWITSNHSQFLSNYDESYIAALKRVLKHLKDT